MVNNQERIDAALVSEHFNQVIEDKKVSIPDAIRILSAFFEIDPLTLQHNPPINRIAGERRIVDAVVTSAKDTSRELTRHLSENRQR